MGYAHLDLRPRYNISPSQVVEAILRDGAEKCLEPMRWGFTPAFVKDPKFAPIYEWRKDERRKTPHFNAQVETIAR